MNTFDIVNKIYGKISEDNDIMFWYILIYDFMYHKEVIVQGQQ